MKIALTLLGIVGFFYLVAMLFMPDWTRPPLATEQFGYRGLGLVEIESPRRMARLQEQQQLPEPLPPYEPTGETAGEVYENVPVLAELDVGDFDRLMVSITDWVSPEEGCTYCHDAENLASDDVYTKVIARGMLEMVRDINGNWDGHVGETGVTCFTCHRGQPVPDEVWFADPGPPQARGLVGGRAGQNAPAHKVGLSSLPFDPFSRFLVEEEDLRVVSLTALPTDNPDDIKKTEHTYGLMMHMSEALGVNCTFCHNTRSFFDWDQSRPQRVTAFEGIRMVRSINAEHLVPLEPHYPAGRLGPLGDAPKANCATCHQGVPKPLFGAQMMLETYPFLAGEASR